MSVTITPQKSTSSILLIATGIGQSSTNVFGNFRISDSSDNAIDGAEEGWINVNGTHSAIQHIITMIGWDTPATTSAVTYKLRFSAPGGGTVTLYNQIRTGQMFAIEVSA
jgi:hypothetical protein